MRRVSFEVAKAIKDAGYPQEGGMYYNEDGDLILPWYFNNEDVFVVAPYYLEVWLWFWREKKMFLSPWYMPIGRVHIDIIDDIMYLETLYTRADPEEAIEAAIEYLVTNKLIK